VSFSIGTGLLSAQRLDHSPQSWTQIYDDLQEMVVAAERAGYESAWVTEHHFTGDGYLSACLPVLAACAARTNRIRLGTNVLLAPLHHPLRLVEDAAVVELISHGRLILGLGIGYRDEEFEAIGVPKSRRVPLLEEIVATCRQAWSGEPFRFRGQELVCRPVPCGPPPIWLGAWVDDGIRRAGRLGDGYISPAGGSQALAHQVALVDESAEAAGRPTPVPLAAPVSVWLTDDGTLPAPLLEGAEHLRRNYGEWYSASSDLGGGREVGKLIRARPEATAGIMVGSPAKVLETLSPLVEQHGREREFHLVVRHLWPGMPIELGLEQMVRFNEEVAPALRRAAS
jgi:alkanesulfonate monooxygenase SsuD/methylene tetrahydromethanopterin reductase-like flavin-dependent oxidoreductase (luciferase family)